MPAAIGNWGTHRDSGMPCPWLNQTTNATNNQDHIPIALWQPCSLSQPVKQNKCTRVPQPAHHSTLNSQTSNNNRLTLAGATTANSLCWQTPAVPPAANNAPPADQHQHSTSPNAQCSTFKQQCHQRVLSTTPSQHRGTVKRAFPAAQVPARGARRTMRVHNARAWYV